MSFSIIKDSRSLVFDIEKISQAVSVAFLESKIDFDPEIDFSLSKEEKESETVI